MESLEPRAMLAFAPLSAVGDMLGNPIILSSDATGPNELTIILDDVTKADIGQIAATITTTDGQTGQYWNFSGITYTASNDTDGSVINSVKLWTSYEADIAGFETAPADDAEVGLSTSWVVANHFPAGGATEVLAMLNVDRLTVTSGVIGGNASTIAGEFESPTLPPDLDATTGAQITLISGTQVTGADIGGTEAFDPIVAYTLSITSQTAGVAPGVDIFTVGDLSITAAKDVTGANLMQSQKGDISVTSISGDLNLNEGSFFAHALEGSVTLTSDCGKVVVSRVCAETDAAISGEKGVTIGIEVDAGNNITLEAMAGGIVARNLTAGNAIDITGLNLVELGGDIVAMQGDISVKSISDAISLDANVHAVTESITFTANQNLLQRTSSGVTRIDVRVPGQFVGTEPPLVTVSVAAPAGSGIAARAIAIVEPGPIVAVPGAPPLFIPVMTPSWVVSKIEIISEGVGYALGENPLVTIGGMPGAVAIATGPQVSRGIYANKDLTVAVGDNIQIVGTVSAVTGDLKMTALRGAVDLGSADVTVHAGGEIAIDAAMGSVDVRRVQAGGNVAIGSEGRAKLLEQVVSLSGSIAAESRSGTLFLQANMHANQGTISISANGGVSQSAGSGLRRVSILNGGFFSGVIPPDVTVVVAPPASGLAADSAKAYAVVTQVGIDANGDNLFQITSIELLDPGRGYALGESPVVTITGMPGAAARAIGPDGFQDIVAEQGVSIAAGQTITLVNTVRSEVGHVEIRSTDGELALGGDEFFVHALEGSVDLESVGGAVTVQKVVANLGVRVAALSGVTVVGSVTSLNGGINVSVIAGTVTVEDFVAQDFITIVGSDRVTLLNDMVTNNGNLAVVSTADSIVMAANIRVAEGGVFLQSHQAITQDRIALDRIVITAGGAGYTNPIVTVSPPTAGGGVAATARAIVNDGRVVKVEIVTSGSGYAPGEFVTITIAQDGNETAQAYGQAGLVEPKIYASRNITLDAGGDVTLFNVVQSEEGGISINSDNGMIDLSDPTTVLQAISGSVSVIAAAGGLGLGNVDADGDITARSLLNLAVSENLRSKTGNIHLGSDAGKVALSAVVSAEQGEIVVSAFGSVKNTSGGIGRVEVLSQGTSYRAGTTRVVFAFPGGTLGAGGVQDGGRLGSRAAVGRVNVDQQGRVVGIDVIDEGDGYLPGETVLVAIIGAGEGATAQAFADPPDSVLSAHENVFVHAGTGVALVATLRSEVGAISILADAGDIAMSDADSLVQALAGDVSITATAGKIEMPKVSAEKSVTIDAKYGVTLIRQVDAAEGRIAFTTTHGNLDLSGGSVVAEAGGVTLASVAGEVSSPAALMAGDSIVVQSFGQLNASGLVQARSGAISLRSVAGNVELNAAVTADNSTITIDAFANVASVSGGVSRVQVVSEGAGYDPNYTRVWILRDEEIVDPLTNEIVPKPGATTNIRENYRPASAVAEVDAATGRVTGITIIDSGKGYLETDKLTVVIAEVGVGGAGINATATAFVDAAVQTLSALDDVIVHGGSHVTLVGVVRSLGGDVSVVSKSGNITASASDAILQALAGGVQVDASAGEVEIRQITAEANVDVNAKLSIQVADAIGSAVGNIAIATTHGDLVLTGSSVVASLGGISLKSLAGGIYTPDVTSAGQGILITSVKDIDLGGKLIAAEGAINVESTAGSVTLNAVISSEKSSASIVAFGSIESAASGVTSIRVLSGGSRYPTNFTRAYVLFSWETIDPNTTEITGDPLEESALPEDFRRAQVNAIVNEQGEVTGFDIVDAGQGYRTSDALKLEVLDIRGANSRTGGGASGAVRVTSAAQDVAALSDVEITAGGEISLVGVLRSFEGDVTIKSISSDVLFTGATAIAQSFQGDVGIIAAGGSVSLLKVTAFEDVDVNAKFKLSLNGGIDSAAGDIRLAATHGDMDLSVTNGTIVAHLGGISLSSTAGELKTPKSLSAGESIAVASLSKLEVNGTIQSKFGDIRLESAGRDVVLNAAVSAEQGSITLKSFAKIKSFSGGLSRIDVVGGGTRYSESQTLMFVLIGGERVDTANWSVTPDPTAAPRDGFQRASVKPVIDSLTGEVTAVEIVNPGTGYRDSDDIRVEIYDTRLPAVGKGASLAVFVDAAFQALVAQDDVLVEAGDEIELIGIVRADAGDVSIVSRSGGVVDISDSDSVVQASQGDVFVRVLGGELLMHQISAGANVDINAKLGIDVSRAIESVGGDIRIRSDQGDIDLDNTDDLKESDEYAKQVRLLAQSGNVEVEAVTGKIYTPESLRANGNISLKSGSYTQLLGIILSDQGNVAIDTAAARVSLNAAVKATEGSVDIRASADFDDIGGGLTKIQMVTFGRSYSAATRVVVSAPKNGGEAARVRPTIEGGKIVNLEIIYPGRGYRPGEVVILNDEELADGGGGFIDSPEFTGDDPGTGAEAIAFCETPTQSIEAGEFVRIQTRDDLKMFGVVRAEGVGGIEMRSTTGNIELTGVGQPTLVAQATQGPVAVYAPGGYARVNDLLGKTNVIVAAEQDVTVLGLVRSSTTSVTIESTSGSIGMEGDGKVHAVVGNVALLARRGDASVQNVFAGEDITIESLGPVKLSETLHAAEGDLTVISTGGIDNAGQVEAGGSVMLTASLGVTSLGGGVVRIDLLSGGYNYEYAIVTVAGPSSGGGRAATARASISEGVITAITIVDPGYGYAAGEVVEIDIEGQPARQASPTSPILPAGEGARAVATANSTSSSLFAGENIAIKAGTIATITNELQAKGGSVAIDVTAGPIKISQIYAAEDVALTAAQTISVGGLLRTSGGDVGIQSTGGGLDMQGIILASAGGVAIETAGPVIQRGSGISRDKVFLLSGGRGYTYALVVIDPPPGAGESALARAEITDPTPFDDDDTGYISSIVLLDPGWGYASDSRVTVRIQGDGEGATAVMGTAVMASTIEAQDDVTIKSGADITLVSTLRSAAGDVGLVATLGDVSIQSITAGKGIQVAANRGEVTLVTVSATEDVFITADQGLMISDSLNTVTGDIVLQSTNDDLTFVQQFNFGDNYLVDDAATSLEPRAVISSKAGSISMTAHNGSIVTPYVINAGADVSLASLLAMELTNQITSQGGDIHLESTSGLVRVRTNLVAEDGSITIEAQTQLQQEFISGISKIELLSPGPMQRVPPAVSVSIAAPRNGGEAATAYAIIERRQLDNNQNNNNGNQFDNIIEYEYFIGYIAIINPGYGYELGENPIVTITGVDGATARAYGPMMVGMISAQQDVNLLAGENITLITKIHAVDGTVTIASKTGDIDLTSNTLFLSSAAGGIDIDAHGGSVNLQRATGYGDVTINAKEEINVLRSVMSENGGIVIASTNNAIDVRQLNAMEDIFLSGFRTSKLVGEIASVAGDVIATSTAGGLRLNANIVAGDDVSLAAQTFIQQLDPTGIEALEVIAEGTDTQVTLTPVPPTVTVTIAPPAAGNPGDRAATARVIIGKRFLGNDPAGTNPIWEFYIKRIEIIDAGSGYAIGESPDVTITGMPGAVVRAIGPTNLRNIEAGDGLSLIARTGTVDLPRALNVSGDILLQSYAPLTTSQQLTSSTGSVTLRSTGGALAVNANVFAAERVTLEALRGITQQAPIVAEELVVANRSSSAITLTNAGNDVAQFAATNVGPVSYTDADDFETGVNRTGPLGVEVTADTLTLSATAPHSKVRVVSGLKYRTLSISAGASVPASVGSVEYVTTSSGDNAHPLVGGISPFAGTLRDMIRYANDNTATYTVAGSARPQPQAMVFDEEGYDVTSIAIAGSALPGFVKPVNFDGGRLTDAVLTATPTARLGIAGAAAVPTGLRFDPGSSGSRVKRLAIGGFSDGVGLVVASGASTVTDVWAGLNRLNVAAPNRVGIEVSGTAAMGNVIGSTVVDATTQNKVANNSLIGLLVRNGAAGTRVFGNQITNNGDGIRIVNATGSLIGTPDARWSDLRPSMSNTITNNLTNGIQVVNAISGSLATANQIRNNYIAGNKASGVAVNGSRFTTIGGASTTAGNVIVRQKGDGVYVGNSADVRVLGNEIGVIVSTEPTTMPDGTQAKVGATPAGNAGNGVVVSKSRTVDIASGNQIAGNTRNGILISSESTGVTVRGNFIGRQGAGNGLDGVAINTAVGNTVSERNVISYNKGSGVSVTDAQAPTLASGNRVMSSAIFANLKDGIRINGGSRTTIGGATASSANVINTNAGAGIRIDSTEQSGSATGHLIQGNLIGTNNNLDVSRSLGNRDAGIRIVAGTSNTVAGGNRVMNNAGAGVEILGGTGNVVGGSTAALGNRISDNTGSGVRVAAVTGRSDVSSALVAARTNRIEGNSIRGNKGHGIEVAGTGVTGLTIGQQVTATSATGLGNQIHGNNLHGIWLNAGAQQVSYQGNSIADNGREAVWHETGPIRANRSTSHVLSLSGAELRGTGATQYVTISGSLSSPTAKQQQYSIDFYANSPEDGDYNGLTGYEARRHIGRATVVADAAGNATFSLRITAPLQVGEVITAMATSLRFEAGSSSMLSNGVTVDLPGVPTPRF